MGYEQLCVDFLPTLAVCTDYCSYSNIMSSSRSDQETCMRDGALQYARYTMYTAIDNKTLYYRAGSNAPHVYSKDKPIARIEQETALQLFNMNCIAFDSHTRNAKQRHCKLTRHIHNRFNSVYIYVHPWHEEKKKTIGNSHCGKKPREKWYQNLMTCSDNKMHPGFIDLRKAFPSFQVLFEVLTNLGKKKTIRSNSSIWF